MVILDAFGPSRAGSGDTVTPARPFPQALAHIRMASSAHMESV
jgi:hypothetical protein